MYPPPMRVIFGGQTIKAFVAAPRNMHVLGIVRMDLEFGLLAMDPQGNYVRVNGSQVTPLDDLEVRRAINKARATSRSDPFEGLAELYPRAVTTLAPKVTIRKRRHIEPARPGAFAAERIAA